MKNEEDHGQLFIFISGPSYAVAKKSGTPKRENTNVITFSYRV
jgi:hypothetical protein